MGPLDGLEGRYVGLACWSFLFVFIRVLSLFLFILFDLWRLRRSEAYRYFASLKKKKKRVQPKT